MKKNPWFWEQLPSLTSSCSFFRMIALFSLRFSDFCALCKITSDCHRSISVTNAVTKTQRCIYGYFVMTLSLTTSYAGYSNSIFRVCVIMRTLTWCEDNETYTGYRGYRYARYLPCTLENFFKESLHASNRQW